MRGFIGMKHAIEKIHFVGIGGSGMNGIAEVLHHEGYCISGSDSSNSPTVQRLAGLGVKTFIGHDASHVEGVDCLVVSTAIVADNPELLAAKAQNIPVISRALMLAELMRMRKGIAIAGTHGKTTTTSLVASVLAAADLDPTFVIGGRLNSAGVNARLGQGEYIVVEADESDASFLNLLPMLAVITNIDADHMETYGQNLARLKGAFIDFLHRMPFYGAAILCVDDPGVQSILDSVGRPVMTYGLSEQARVRAVDVVADHGQMRFTVRRQGAYGLPDLPIVLNAAGLHNVCNALAAICIACELGVPDAAIQTALAEFKGVGRRFQHYGRLLHQGKSFDLIDDYGHHPVEMQATIAAARGAYPGRRLLLAFQPHRYSRTRDCFEDFVRVLGTVDALALAEVYSAGETPIVGADGRALARSVRLAEKVEPHFVPEIEHMSQAVLDILSEGDVVVCMGAGSIGAVPNQIKQLAQEGAA
jgi:UDP-N-acetylmuramate--alanine ligase